MSKPPYFPFYPKDFAADEKVELMSTPAVGAYILLLCKAWHQEPPASLPDDDRVLARLARMTPDEWQAVRSEVVEAFTAGKDGRLHQKRLRREYDLFSEKSKKASESAKRRWDRKKSDGNANAYANAPPTHCEGNARASGSGSGSNSGSENQKKNKDSAKFDEFWEGVPNKIGKGAARTAYQKAIKGGATHDEIVAGLETYRQYEAKRERQQDYRPLHPATWLNQERWADQLAGGSASRSEVSSAKWESLGAETHRELLAEVKAAEPDVAHTAGNMDTQRAMRRLAKSKGLL